MSNKKPLPTIEEAIERVKNGIGYFQNLTSEQKEIAMNAPDEAETLGFDYHTVVVEIRMKSNSQEEAKKEVEDWLDKTHHRHFPKNMLSVEVIDEE